MPFISLSSAEFEVLNSENKFSSIELLLAPKEKDSRFFDNANKIYFNLDNDENHIAINSQYYDINEFNKLDFKPDCSFSIGHVNIASLNKHVDDLYNLLSMLNHPFDVIGITEHKIGKFQPINNTKILGYNFCFDMTQTTHGGTGFYISDKYSFRERKDLNINAAGELESTFIEIFLPKNQSIICGCIYKHPNMSISEFSDDYLSPTLNKISSSNKKCILVGDFNIDLLNLQFKESVEHFYNNLTSYFFLPFILQPTRITEHSKTLIDNIFFNSLEYNSYSGNLTVQISDHLFQFLILKDFVKPLLK